MRKLVVLAVLALAILVAGCSGHTTSATNIARDPSTGQYSAKLNAVGGCDTNCTAHMRWRVQGQSNWINGPDINVGNVPANTPWSQTATGLFPGAAYEYQTCGKESAMPDFVCVGPDGNQNTTTGFYALGVSGQAMPTGDISGWHQIFADDFPADVGIGSWPSAVSSKWSAYPCGWTDTSGRGTYCAEKTVSQQNGALYFYIHTEGSTHYVMAPQPKVTPTSPYGQTYGRYSIRFRSLNNMSCYKTAWLLWPNSDIWPGDGEIDFPEGRLDGIETISAFAHHANPNGGQDGFDTGQKYDQWHTATTEWAPGSVKFYLDSNLIGTSTVDVPHNPMHWVLQTETSTDPSCPVDNGTAGYVQIDWATAYSYAP